MDYYSVRVTTSNENGDREVCFEMRRTLLDWLLRRPARVHTFVQKQEGRTVWWRKGSGRRAGTAWEWECCNAVEWVRQQAHNANSQRETKA